MKNYNAKHVVVTVAGTPLTGMGESGFVKVARMTPDFSTKAGADGLVVRSQSADERGTIEVTMLASSPSNAVLQALLTADRASGLAVFPVSVADLHGRALVTAPQCWVTGDPEVSFANEESEVVWTLEAARIISQVSGSSL